MTLRTCTILSVLLNLALVVGLIIGRPRPGIGPARPDGPGEVWAKAASAEPGAPPSPASASPREFADEAAGPFHWSQIYSTNLQHFTANLRAIGCPPETVRAIIERELWSAYLSRRRVILEQHHREFWSELAGAGDPYKMAAPYEQPIEKLKAATLDQLDPIVGPDPAEAPDDPERVPRPALDHLSPGTQQAIAALNRRIDEAVRKLRPADGRSWTLEIRAKQAELEEERGRARQELLTGEERAELELRDSRYADKAREAHGFAATSDEARAVARIYEEFAAADVRTARNDPEAAAKQAAAEAAQRQREDALKAALGSVRYAEFKQGQDQKFAEVFPITERYGLTRAAAAEAASVLEQRESALRALQADASLSVEDRAQRELAVQVATREALAQSLGDRALKTYEKYHGAIIPAPRPPEK